MTQPDGLFPAGAFNLDSLAELAARPQSEWEATIRGQSSNGFEMVLSALFGPLPEDLREGIEFTRAVITAIIRQILNLPGQIWDSVEDAFAALSDWVSEIPILSDIVAMINGIISGLLDGSILVDAGNLIGSLAASLFTLLPIGALSPVSPNLLPAPRFALDSIAPGGAWSVDMSRSRSGDLTGAAKVVADGSAKALRSGRSPSDVIGVSEGQTFTGTVYVSHEGYVGSGPAVLLQVVPFVDGVSQDPVLLDSFVPAGADLAWPGHELSGDYVVPDGVSGVQTRIVVTESAAAGTFFFDDADAKQSGKLRQEWIDGLPESLQQQLARWQLLVDTVHNAFTGTSSVFNSIEDLAEALLSIPFGNIRGILGPIDIGETVAEIVNSIVGGLVGQAGNGAGLADLFNVAKLVSAMASQGSNAWDVLGLRANRPVDGGLMPSERSNFPLSNVTDWLSATQTTSLIGLDLIEESMPIGVISWIGYGISGITEFYVVVWRVDLATGDFTLVHESDNVVGILAGTASPGAFISYELDEPVPAVAGEAYAYELVPVGGTHHVRGRIVDLPNHPTAQVVALAATRNNSGTRPSTIAKADVTRSANVPWVGIAVDTGTGGDHHDPLTVYLPGSTEIPIPNWANHVDVVPLGGAGAGSQGATVGLQGDNGDPGKFAAATWHRGEHFSGSATIITVDVGAGGDGGFGAGGDGEDTTVSIPGFSVTAEGGNGGSGVRIGARIPAPGPGEFEYNGETYTGGGDQNTYGAKGAAPGGAGSGGNWLAFQFGGDGADGAAWIRFRKDSVDGEVDTSDTTPPTAPSLSVDSSTFSTLTVTASGATDD